MRTEQYWGSRRTGRGIVDDIDDELQRQDILWGEQNHRDGTGPKEIISKFDRLSHDYLLWLARNRDADERDEAKLSWAAVLFEETAEALAESNETKLRDELVQVAAVAVQWIAAIDRRSSDD